MQKHGATTKEEVVMSLVGGRYQGTYRATANTRADGQAETYLVWVRAKDGQGNETPLPGVPKEGESFSVKAPLKPIDPPF